MTTFKGAPFPPIFNLPPDREEVGGSGILAANWENIRYDWPWPQILPNGLLAERSSKSYSVVGNGFTLEGHWFLSGIQTNPILEICDG